MKAPPIRPRLVALMIALVAIIAFAPALFGNWVYDDFPLIAQNPYAHALAHWPRWFTHDFWDLNPESHLATRLTYWRPLINGSYGMDWTIGGGSPVMFHITNTLAHAGVAVMAFFTLRRWVGAVWPAALAAVLFAVMPSKAPNVAWIAGRTDVVCALMMLVALTGIARRLEGKRGGIALEIVGTLGAYLSKEQAVVLPAFVVIEVWVAAGRPAIDLAFVKRSIGALVPQVLVAIAYLASRAVFLPIRNFNLPHRPVVDQALSLLDGLGRFVAELVVPLDATIRHGLIDAGDHTWPFVLLGTLTLIAGGAVVFVCRRRQPAVSLALVALFVASAPTVVMVSQQLAALVSDRFLYIPSLAMALLLAALLAGGRPTTARIGGAFVGAVALCFLLLSVHRAAFYIDEPTFADHEVELHPENYDAHRFRVDTALRRGQSRRAVGYLLDTLPATVPVTRLTTAYEIADVATQTVPDLDTDSLHALDDFVGHLIARDRHIELHIPEVSLSIDLPPMNASAPLIARMNALRANLASRLDETPRALELIQHSLDTCDSCATFVSIRALILARSGQIDDGIAELAKGATDIPMARLRAARAHFITAGEHFNRARTLTGPQALQENHAGLAELGQWGKAYHLLLPRREQLLGSAGLAETYAGTAYRAGRTDDAREALARYHTPTEIDALLAAWAEDMGWSP